MWSHSLNFLTRPCSREDALAHISQNLYILRGTERTRIKILRSYRKKASLWDSSRVTQTTTAYERKSAKLRMILSWKQAPRCFSSSRKLRKACGDYDLIRVSTLPSSYNRMYDFFSYRLLFSFNSKLVQCYWFITKPSWLFFIHSKLLCPLKLTRSWLNVFRPGKTRSMFSIYMQLV